MFAQALRVNVIRCPFVNADAGIYIGMVEVHQLVVGIQTEIDVRICFIKLLKRQTSPLSANSGATDRKRLSSLSRSASATASEICFRPDASSRQISAPRLVNFSPLCSREKSGRPSWCSVLCSCWLTAPEVIPSSSAAFFLVIPSGPRLQQHEGRQG